jgi:hypothetical protein
VNGYAARIEDGTVTQVIVGTADWAADRLGGDWIDSAVKVGVGWHVVDGTITPPEPQDDGEAEAIALAGG